ncbi:MAG: tyrosine--tRNA ligase, partial [Candidatus Bathyarchaeia archaeon]
DAAEKLGRKKPVCIHTPLRTGLRGRIQTQAGEFDEDREMSVRIGSKMSKSVEGSAILVHDSPEEIEQKIRDAFCPPRESKGNPVAEIAKYIIFPERGKIKVERPQKYGGEIVFNNYEDLEKCYLEGSIHPLDLKEAVSRELSEILKPVREHFSRDPKILEEMKKIEVTR